VRADGQPAVYLIDGGVRRHVPSPYALATWRLPGEQIEVLPAAEVEAFPEGIPLDESPYLVVGPGGAVHVVDRAPLPPAMPPPAMDGGPLPDADSGGGDGENGDGGVARQSDASLPGSGGRADGGRGAAGSDATGGVPGAPGNDVQPPGTRSSLAGGCALAGRAPSGRADGGAGAALVLLALLLGVALAGRPRRDAQRPPAKARPQARPRRPACR
jgi:hypothetical protein